MTRPGDFAAPIGRIREGMERLYTPAQVSEMLGVSVKTLEKWRWEQRNLPYVKLGTAVRYKESDLTAWLGAHTVDIR